MEEVQHTLLVVEDDLDVSEMLSAYFRVQGYSVLVANGGVEGVALCLSKQPDLVILDIRMPDIDGYEVARRVRHDRRTAEIPIIFLTDRRTRQDRLQGLSLGADDYVTKPFDIQELRLRVRNALSRMAKGSLTNPVTGLPEGVLVDEMLEDCLKRRDWALLLISLVNLDPFREAYGFVASDDVLRAVNLMIHNAVQEAGNAADFIGQYSPTAFILVASPAVFAGLTERIRFRLEQTLDYFYPLKDRSLKTPSAQRLSVRLKALEASDGPFRDVGELKAALERD